MNSLLIIGAGGHGRVLADAAMAMNRWGLLCFLDDREDLTEVLGLQVISGCERLPEVAHDFSAAAVGIGNAVTRLSFIEQCKQIGLELPVVVHPSAAVSSFASLGYGTVVFAQAAVNAGARLGPGCIVNTGATVDHDCDLAAGVHVCPGAHLGGDVRVGQRTWIGVGSCVKQGIVIGEDVTVGAGAAVVSDAGSTCILTGVPARSTAASK